MVKKIDLSKCELVMPKAQQKKTYAFSIMLDGTIRINSKLVSAMRKKSDMFLLYIDPDDKRIYFVPAEASQTAARNIRKDGIIKAAELLECLPAYKIPMPVHYIVDWEEEEHLWIGTIDPAHKFRMQTSKKIIRRPRKKDLEDMLPKEVI